MPLKRDRRWSSDVCFLEAIAEIKELHIGLVSKSCLH